MESLWPQIEPLLAQVTKPARYIGGELGAQQAQHGPDAVSWLLVYPDTYEVGLPNQGLQILYEILNERPDAAAERSYAPWTDMEAAMRAAGVPLFSVEGHHPAGEFDVIAFNLSAELVYTNVLNLIDLAGVPVRGADRALGHPVVIAGGHCAFNPEPLADFVDCFVLGDGEEVVGEVNEVLAAFRCGPARAGGDERGREALLRALSGVDGVYVPSCYEVTYDDAGRLVGAAPRFAGTPDRVEKRTIADLGAWPYPRRQLVPLIEVVHDRLNVELFRGCTRGCRFCQAGMITRPVRERPADQVRTMVSAGLERTGYDEVALTSLSSADYSGIQETVTGIIDDPACSGQVSVSLPSLRVDAFTVGTAAQIQRVRRTGLTFAPEGGTWRMRQVINKLIREEDLYAAVDAAFSQGWKRVKLYFLIGLPTETDEDTLGIVALAKQCVAIGKRHHGSVTVTASVGGFVPKVQTPFQWFGQNTIEELTRKVHLLRDAARPVRGLTIRWHDPKATAAEGIVSRGDRRMGAVIEQVWRRGGTFQEWSEHFDLDLWTDALAAHGMTLEDTVYRHRTEDEVLPWDHVSAGLHRDFLWQDWRDALAEHGLPDCRWTPCYDCGACTGYGVEHVVASAVPPAGGSQGTGQDLSTGGQVPVRFLPTAPSGAAPAHAPVGAPARRSERGGADVRIRFRFSKLGKIRFTSQRDVARMWERALRRARLPLAYTEGFSPRPQLSFGLALPTGAESLAEYVDVALEPTRAAEAGVDPAALPVLLDGLLPEGLQVQEAVVVERSKDSLQQMVTSCSWTMRLVGVTADELSAMVAALLAADAVPITRERKGREEIDDLRPSVLALAVADPAPEAVADPTGRTVGLVAELSTRPRGVRPVELLRGLIAVSGGSADRPMDGRPERGLPGSIPVLDRACRTEQWIERDGLRQEPLLGRVVPAGTDRATHALERVS